MKKIVFTIIFCVSLSPFFADAQCTTYVPSKVGEELEYYAYDKNGKHEGIEIHKLNKVETKGDTTYFDVYQKVMDADLKNTHERDLVFKCSGDKFFFDMYSLIDERQFADMGENVNFTVDFDQMYIPAKLKVGEALPDGSLTFKFNMGMMTMSTSFKFFDRKVESMETITTPAGTFEAYKVCETMESQTGFGKVIVKSVFYYVENIGSVKTETYDEDGNLTGSIVLNKITK